MVSEISESFARRLVKKEIITGQDIEVYQFGIECIIMKACHLISYFLIAVFFHMVLEVFVFLIAFIPLRVYSGGYHAKTPLKCYLISCCTILSVMCLIRFTPLYIIQYSSIIAMVVSVILLMIAPVETSTKPLDETEKRYYKKKAGIMIMADLGLVLIFGMFLSTYISFIITLSLAYELGIALIGKYSISSRSLYE